MLFGSAEASSAHATEGSAGRRRPASTSVIVEAVKKLALYAVISMVMPWPDVSRFRE
jgi:hypothetical protein